MVFKVRHKKQKTAQCCEQKNNMKAFYDILGTTGMQFHLGIKELRTTFTVKK